MVYTSQESRSQKGKQGEGGERQKGQIHELDVSDSWTVKFSERTEDPRKSAAAGVRPVGAGEGTFLEFVSKIFWL